MTVPSEARCTLPECDREAVNPWRRGALCEFHRDEGETDEPVTETEASGELEERQESEIGISETDVGSGWREADFTDPEPGVFAPEWGERERWMCRIPADKHSVAPWGDRDHPEAEPDEDARYKWGLTDNYADLETALEWDDKHPRTDGVSFQLLEADAEPFAFVDGDDVRCPETGEVHPAFLAALEELGLTYADVSQSGAGVHALYRGDLPDGVKQAAFAIDTEPWGANDDVPSVEIYDHKHVCIATGEHVPGTPTEVRTWDERGLEDLLDEHDQLPDPEPERPADAFDGFDTDDYEPVATSASDTTDDIRDLFAAIDALDARRVAEKTIVHAWNDSASTSDGERAFDPTFGGTSNGTANIVNEDRWLDTGTRGGYGGPVVMAAIDANLVDDRNCPDAVRGAAWFQAVDHLRDLGFDVPHLESLDDTGAVAHTAVLPPAVQDFTTAASGWDWRNAGRDPTVSIDDARDRTTEAIADAYASGDRVLVEALPTMGKSYGAVKAAAETGRPVSIFTGRGRKEQYEQFREWCDEHGLEYKTLPAFTRDCDTANGEHGAEWKATVRSWYGRGATPQTIHKWAEDVLGRPLPCQTHEGQSCPYAAKWDFDPDDYDVLIGHYAHAHKSKVTAGRTVVFDEFADAYETRLGDGLQEAVSYWLSTVDAIPFDDYTDLIEHRDDEQRRSDALAWFLDEDLAPDETQVFDDESAHAAAPLAVFTLLASVDLGIGFESAGLKDAGTGVFNRETGAVSLLRPPALEYASGVVALDGTPTQEMWELALGERLNHRPVLQDEERAAYIEEALNLNLVRTTDAVKPYNNPDHVAVKQDAALLEGIADVHGERPAVITSATAVKQYDSEGVLDVDLASGGVEAGPASRVKWYGDVLGSNEFDDVRLGAVIGSNHYGDGYIKKWAAFADEAVERGDEKGAALSYGTFGDKVLAHMREHDTLQAAMRFGRDGNGAVVYVHTDMLPEWVPLAGEGRVVTTWSDGMRSVVRALKDLDDVRTEAIAAHPAVDVGVRQVFDHLETLRERGFLSRRPDPNDGRGVQWVDDGLHRANDHGDVDLEPVALDEVGDDEVQELARSTTYTWEFTNSSGGDDASAGRAGAGASTPSQATANGGDRLPDDAG